MSAAAVEVHEGWLRVRFSAEEHADFHLRWLRHNCDQDLHPLTRERTACSSSLPDELLVTRAVIDGDSLLVSWEHDDRTSCYSLRWLHDNAYARNRAPAMPPPSDLSRIEIDGAGLTLAQRVERALGNLDEHGAAVVRSSGDDAPPEAETELIIAAFEERGLKVISTHFGRIEDLRTDNTTNQNTDQLGYTDAAVEPHTDQPFLDAPPRLQLLQVIRPARVGGESYVVDARAVAEFLRDSDVETYALLTQTTVRFHRRQRAFERIVDSPILRDEDGRFLVRYSYFTLAPYAMPFERMAAWYRAHDRFARLVRDRRYQYRFLLRAGDFLLYDNHRMLHARTAFSGARWLRGIYFDR